jgi:hypothetical protein
MADASGNERSSFAANVIDTEQIFDACITAVKLATDSVITAKIQDDAVTSDKIAPGVLTQHVRNMVAYAAIGHTTVTTPIGTIPAGALIKGCIVSITEAYNGTTPSIDIGVAGDHDSLLPTASIARSLNSISGEDPATYGVELWVPGVQTAIAQTTTASDWALSALTVDSGTHAMASHTQATTAGDYTVTASPIVTTYGHPRKKYLAADTVYNAYTAAGTGTTTGTADVFILYDRVVMAD